MLVNRLWDGRCLASRKHKVLFYLKRRSSIFFFHLWASPITEHYGQKQAELTCHGIQALPYRSFSSACRGQSVSSPCHGTTGGCSGILLPFNPEAHSHLASKSSILPGWDSLFGITTVLNSWCYCRVWSTTFMRSLCPWDISLTQLYRWGVEGQRDQVTFPGTYRWALMEEQFESCSWTGG